MDEKVAYLADGTEVVVVEKIEGKALRGYLVQDVYEDDEYVPRGSGTIYYVEKVYDKAPTKKYDDNIALLKKSIADLTKKESELRNAIINMEVTNVERRKEYAKFEQLRTLDSFIAGKITHYVEISYGTPRIVEFGKAVCTSDKRTLKLLTLFGNSNGNLSWGLNDYKDGSGSHTTVIPCTSYDEAYKVLRKYVEKEFEDEPSKSLIDTATKYSIAIPRAYIDKYNEQERKRLEAVIADRKRYLEESKSELEMLK